MWQLFTTFFNSAQLVLIIVIQMYVRLFFLNFCVISFSIKKKNTVSIVHCTNCESCLTSLFTVGWSWFILWLTEHVHCHYITLQSLGRRFCPKRPTQSSTLLLWSCNIMTWGAQYCKDTLFLSSLCCYLVLICQTPVLTQSRAHTVSEWRAADGRWSEPGIRVDR